MTNKEKIIKIFNDNVKGKKSNTIDSNQKHCGKEGHWLEKQMGIKPNGKNEADLLGYEMKNETTSGKTTFGDWSADEYIYLHGRKKQNSINKEYNLSRDDFFDIFGKPNENKNNRPSWSGEPVPTYYNQVSSFGQKLDLDENNNIVIKYSFSNDKRSNKDEIVPTNMQKDDLTIAKWNKETLQKKIERKFNQDGFFKCNKDSNGNYDSIDFGKKINYDSWMELFKNQEIMFDSGMYKGNKRPYSQWRAKNKIWDNLIEDTY